MPRVSASALIPVRLSSFGTAIRFEITSLMATTSPVLVHLLRWAPVSRGKTALDGDWVNN